MFLFHFIWMAHFRDVYNCNCYNDMNQNRRGKLKIFFKFSEPRFWNNGLMVIFTLHVIPLMSRFRGGGHCISATLLPSQLFMNIKEIFCIGIWIWIETPNELSIMNLWILGPKIIFSMMQDAFYVITLFWTVSSETVHRNFQ